jgi:hypothetical protein
MVFAGGTGHQITLILGLKTALMTKYCQFDVENYIRLTARFLLSSSDTTYPIVVASMF